MESKNSKESTESKQVEMAQSVPAESIGNTPRNYDPMEILSLGLAAAEKAIDVEALNPTNIDNFTELPRLPIHDNSPKCMEYYCIIGFADGLVQPVAFTILLSTLGSPLISAVGGLIHLYGGFVAQITSEKRDPRRPGLSGAVLGACYLLSGLIPLVPNGIFDDAIVAMYAGVALRFLLLASYHFSTELTDVMGVNFARDSAVHILTQAVIATIITYVSLAMVNMTSYR